MTDNGIRTATQGRRRVPRRYIFPFFCARQIYGGRGSQRKSKTEKQNRVERLFRVQSSQQFRFFDDMKNTLALECRRRFVQFQFLTNFQFFASPAHGSDAALPMGAIFERVVSTSI